MTIVTTSPNDIMSKKILQDFSIINHPNYLDNALFLRPMPNTPKARLVKMG